MADAILTLNAGSSSIKFALFDHGGDIPCPPSRNWSARSTASVPAPTSRPRTRRARCIDDSDLPPRRRAAHRAALAFLVRLAARPRRRPGGLPASAIASCMAPRRYSQAAPARRGAPSTPCAASSRWRRCTSRTTSPASRRCAPHCPACRRSPASTPPSTAASRKSRSCFALPRRITAQGVRRYGFHGLSYEYIADVLPQPSARVAPRAASSSPTWATVPRCARMKGLQEPGHHHGLHRRRGPDDGHPHRQPRPRRAALPDGLSGHGRQGPGASCSTRNPACSASPASRQDMRELLASDQPEAQRGGRPVLLPHRARDRLAGRRPRRARCAGVHRRHRRTRRAGAAAHMRRARLAGHCEFDIAANATATPAASATAASRVDVLVLPTNEEWMIARHTAELIG